MKYNSIIKVMFYTMIVLAISSFSYYPKSYSKYMKDEEPVKFHVGIDKLYIGEFENISPMSTSTYKVVNYQLKFYRSQVMKDYDEKQQIKIEIVQDLCAITNVSSNGTKSINANKATITYNNKGEDFITVDYKCNVSDITKVEAGLEMIYTNVRIYEKFLPENIQYLYMKGSSTKTLLTEYYQNFPKPDDQIVDEGRKLIIPIDADDKYEAFETWISQYSNSLNNTYSNEILEYISTVYNSESDILDLTKTLKGLKASYDSVNEAYVYQLENSFLGYARTYYSYIGPELFLKAIFIDPTLTDQESNEIFRYYLDEYGVYTTQEKDNIMKYVSDHGSLNYITKTNINNEYNTLVGFTYDQVKDEIVISKTLHNLASSYADKKIYIDFYGEVEMFQVFLDSMTLAYDFLTDNLIENMSKNVNIYMSIRKNRNQDGVEKIEYSDYLTIKDTVTNKFILLNIYSDKIKTYVEMTELGVADSISIVPSDDGNGNKKLDISITLDNQDTLIAKDNLLVTIKALDTYFNTNYEIDVVDELFTTDILTGNITSTLDATNNKVTINYSIQQ